MRVEELEVHPDEPPHQVSILYLRCLSWNATVWSIGDVVCFNSLFEMRYLCIFVVRYWKGNMFQFSI